MKNFHIEICGVIASGKTTLTQLLGDQKKISISPIFENFEINPFLESFYKNPAKFSFETEISFLLQHYHDIKVRKENFLSFICDFSLELDRSFADVTLLGKRRNIFSSIADELQNEIGLPTNIIFLTCPENILLKRIKRRNRKVEESITIDYLIDLKSSIERRLNLISNQIPIIEINSNQIDFCNSNDDRIDVVNKIISEL